MIGGDGARTKLTAQSIIYRKISEKTSPSKSNDFCSQRRCQKSSFLMGRHFIATHDVQGIIVKQIFGMRIFKIE